MNQSLPAPLDVKLMNLTASVLFLCCVLLLLAAGARWVLRYPGFSVARIVVQGELVHNNAVTLRANVAPQLAGNFFTIDLRAARAAFEQAPWVRKALVRREFPGGLRVELQEHDAVAFWGGETGSALVNSRARFSRPMWAMWSKKACPASRVPRVVRPRCCRCTAYCSHCLSRWAWLWMRWNSPGAAAGAPRSTPAQRWSWEAARNKKWCNARSASSAH